MKILTALVPLLPLISFLVIGLNFRRMSKTLTVIFACGSVFASFICSIVLFYFIKSGNTPVNLSLFDWLSTSKTTIQFSLVADQLSILMMLIVTGVGLLIHIYSVGYMNEDEGFNRFFAYMN